MPHTQWIDELIEQFGLSDMKEDIREIVQPSIRIKTSKVENEAEIPIGESKIGGLPDLPKDVKWPEWAKGHLTFIAQLNLIDVAAYDVETVLPISGMLYFFYDAIEYPWGRLPEGKGWHVIYHAGNSDLSRTATPADLMRRALADSNGYQTSEFKPCKVDFSKELTLPGSETPYVQDFYENDSIARIKLTRENGDQYFGLCSAVQKAQGGGRVINHVLGHPDQIQGNLQLSCQLNSHGITWNDPGRKALEKGQVDWLLLLQIDSDDNAGMMWGDVGRIYYFIQKDMLKALNFDAVEFELQCT